MSILVTGCAGFIGFHVTKQLLARGEKVVGVDNLNDYYDPRLKKDRLLELARLDTTHSFTFYKQDISELQLMREIFTKKNITQIIHLAAQAGIRFSTANPRSTMEVNVMGFMNILECAREYSIAHLVYASSSSVYGLNQNQPYSVRDTVDHPISMYAVSKKSNELMAHCYSHLYNLPVTGLRFFTVYGPWGRPDMSPIIFAKSISEGTTLNIFNNGEMSRDFTYVEDVAESVVRILQKPSTPTEDWDGVNPDSSTSHAPYRIYNIGSNNPIYLGEFIELIERKLGKKAKKNYMPIQPGELKDTHADIGSLYEDINYTPSTSFEDGITQFVDWFKAYY